MNSSTANPNAVVNAQSQALNFNASTRRLRQPLSQVTFNGLSQFQRVDVPQVGFASYYIVQLTGTITTGTSAAGNWSNCFPYNLLATLAYRSNEGTEVYRTSGYGNLAVQSVINDSFSPQGVGTMVTPATIATTSGMKTGVYTSPVPGAAIASSTAYPIMVTYMIPVAADQRLSAGLLLLQNQSTRAQIEMTVNVLVGNGGINGIGNASANLGTGATIALTANISVEFFNVPQNGARPDENFMHRWIEERVPWTASGTFSYIVPVNGIITRVIALVENAGTLQPWYATAATPSTINVGNYQVTYAASQAPEVERMECNFWRMAFNYSAVLPDGMFVFEFSNGGGDVLMGLNGRDTYDTAYLTEFKLKMDLNVTPGSNSVITFCREELQRRVAPQ